MKRERERGRERGNESLISLWQDLAYYFGVLPFSYVLHIHNLTNSYNSIKVFVYILGQRKVRLRERK